MRAAALVASALVASLMPVICADTSTPRRSLTLRTVTCKPVETLSWGDMGTVRAGVAVRVHKPVPVAEPGRDNRRAVSVTVVVHNRSLGQVRLDVGGRVGSVELLPEKGPRPVVGAWSVVTVRRVLWAPDTLPPVEIQVAATVDGLPVGGGWRYSGGIS